MDLGKSLGLKTIQKYWEEKPLVVILIAAAFFRILASIFSKGFGFLDDHFLIVEAGQSWADGYDYNNWLPTSGTATPSGHSFFYPGLHFLFFKFCHFLHFEDPQGKMYVLRFLHAAFSMITVVIGYRITFHYAGKRTARMAGILLSIYWFIPILCVRNMVEVFCIPFLMYSTWLLIRVLEKERWQLYLFAGLLAGIAFSVRFQTLFFIGGMGIVLLLKKKWKGSLVFGLGALITIIAIQGPVDYHNWGYPFAELLEYYRYNLANATTYFSRPWHMYFLVLFGILLPPISVFLLFGFLRKWKTHLLLFLPAAIFFAFHSYFPNKQERFILPVIPFVVMLGMIGWHEFQDKSSFWAKRKKLLNGLWIFFWIINTIPLLFISVSYSKRDRVESMTYLMHKGDVTTFVVEAGNRDDFIMPPLFYLKKWPVAVYSLTKKLGFDSLNYCVDMNPKELEPNYVIFNEDVDIQQRISNFDKYYAEIKPEVVIQQGMLDRLLHFLNPVNKSQTCYIYRIIKRRQEWGAIRKKRISNRP